MRGWWCAGALAIGLGVLAGCGGGLKGVWNGSGQVGEARFFSILLDTTNVEKPAATVQFGAGEAVRLPVCALKQVEKHVEFRLDVDGRAESCETATAPLVFAGDWGRDVMTGRVADAAGNAVGMFRAFRVAD